MWKIWVADRERFRKVGVRGGKDGELGQGMWSLRKGRGFEEWYNFDGFLGMMGPYRRREVKGLEALYGRLHPDEEGDGAAGDGEGVGEGEGVAAARMLGGRTPVTVILGLSEPELEPKVESKAEGEAEGSGHPGKKKKNKNKNKKKSKATTEEEEKAQVAE